MDEPIDAVSARAKRRHGKLRVGGFAIYLSIATLLAFILSLYFLAKGKAFAFYDFGSDTFSCFYPLQVAIARQLQTLHTVTWSFELGLGAFPGQLFDPLWLVTGWLPVSWQLSLRLPMFLFRLLAAGGFFYGYLRQIGFRTPVAVIGGLGYAFSNYGVINGQWEVMQGTEFVQFAAYLFLLERYLQRRKISAAVFAGVVVGLGHPLGLYMFALFSLAYGSVRIAASARPQRKAVFLAFLQFAGLCMLGVALTAPLLFPEIYYLLDSPRVSGDHAYRLFPGSLFTVNDFATIGSELAGLLGKDLIGTGPYYSGWQNYFEGPGFYMGLLPLLCMPQLIGPGASRNERMLFLAGVVGCALYFICPALRYAVYGFGHMAFRFSTLWIAALLLVLGLRGLQRALLSGWWRPGVTIGAAAIFVIALGATVRVPGSVNTEHLTRVIAFTLVYAAFALLAAGARDKRTAAWLLAAVCACELVTFATPSLQERGVVGADGSAPNGQYGDGTAQVLEYIRHLDHDEQFYRIEKTYFSVFLDDSLVQGYSGTGSYYFHGSEISRFVDRMRLPRYVQQTNYIGPITPRTGVLSLLGVRYVLTRKRSLDGTSAMTHVGVVGDVDIYRNDAAHGFASFYDSVVSEAQADVLAVPERDALVLTKVIVDNPADVDARLAALRATSLAPGASRQAVVRKLRDDELRGEVTTPTASLLLLAMPFDRGWSARLDGGMLDLFRADYGLTAALIPAGTHTIALEYVAPGRPIGVALMCGVLAAMGVFGILSGALGRLPALAARLGPSVAARLRTAVSRVRQPGRRT